MKTPIHHHKTKAMPTLIDLIRLLQMADRAKTVCNGPGEYLGYNSLHGRHEFTGSATNCGEMLDFLDLVCRELEANANAPIAIVSLVGSKPATARGITLTMALNWIGAPNKTPSCQEPPSFLSMLSLS